MVLRNTKVIPLPEHLQGSACPWSLHSSSQELQTSGKLTVMNPEFIHLRVHSEFSIIDGLVRIPELVKKNRVLNMPAVAVTDFSNLFALVKFYRSALQQGIKAYYWC
jgi:DNA polymerase III alpha subunit (gram-positive type)